MRKLLALLLVSLAIPSQASNTYVYAPGLDSAIQHWVYPNTVAMTTDFGFYSQDIGKIAFNKGDGIYYYLADTAPTWTPMATGGGGGSTTFVGLIDTPSSYTGAAGQLVAVNGTATGLVFQAAAGGGNVSNVATPATDETAVWTDATHIKGVRTLAGGGAANYILTKLSGTDYDYGWAAPGGSVVSITATTPIAVTPDPITGTGTISLTVPSDLSALEALTGTNTIYYRSGANTWTPVTMGSNMTFLGGTLDATVGGAGTNAFGTIVISGQSSVVADAAPDTLTLVAGTNVTLTTNAATDTVTIASSGGASGVTSISATSPIQVSPNPITSTGTISIESSSDLGALEALSGTNTLYYRSGASAWSAVTIGSNVTFSGGSLAAGNTNWDTGFNERRQWDGGSTNLNATLGRSNLGATTIGANVFTATNPASTSWIKISNLGAVTLEDAGTTRSSLGLNTANWDTAYTDRMKWDTSLGISGGTTGQGRTALGATTIGSNVFTLANPVSTSWIKVGSTGTITLEDAGTTKTSLSLNSVTNDVQAWASIYPNSGPGAGGLAVGTGSGGYFPRTVSGSGATITMGSTGVITLNNIANGTLTNSSMTIAGTSTALGGAVTQDQITGLGGQPVGLLKRSAVNGMAIAVAGTDYKVGTTNTINVRMVASTATFTPTAGVTALYFEGVGGGGGGGSIYVTNSFYAGGGGGGGGGGYAAVYVPTPAASYAITIGAGGAGGVGTSNDAGNAGGNTVVGTILTAGGGGGGGAGQGGYYMGLITGIGGDGGVGTVGGMLGSGTDGDNGLSMAYSFTAPSTFAGNGFGGAGGGSMFGGGAKGPGSSLAGNAGGKYGGGGSGGAVCGCTSVPLGKAGGIGAVGVVRVWEIF